MKDTILALLIMVALIAGFSRWGGAPMEVDTTPRGHGTQIRGDSGMVIPGNGVDPAMTPTAEAETEAVAEAEPETVAGDVFSVQVNITEGKGEENIMNEILVAFWHGVAAVFLGGAGTILIAVAWAKIKKS